MKCTEKQQESDDVDDVFIDEIGSNLINYRVNKKKV